MVQSYNSNNNNNQKIKKKTFKTKQINKRLSRQFCERDLGLDLTGSLPSNFWNFTRMALTLHLWP